MSKTRWHLYEEMTGKCEDIIPGDYIKYIRNDTTSNGFIVAKNDTAKKLILLIESKQKNNNSEKAKIRITYDTPEKIFRFKTNDKPKTTGGNAGISDEKYTDLTNRVKTLEHATAKITTTIQRLIERLNVILPPKDQK